MGRPCGVAAPEFDWRARRARACARQRVAARVLVASWPVVGRSAANGSSSCTSSRAPIGVLGVRGSGTSSCSSEVGAATLPAVSRLPPDLAIRLPHKVAAPAAGSVGPGRRSCSCRRTLRRRWSPTCPCTARRRSRSRTATIARNASPHVQRRQSRERSLQWERRATCSARLQPVAMRLVHARRQWESMPPSAGSASACVPAPSAISGARDDQGAALACPQRDAVSMMFRKICRAWASPRIQSSRTSRPHPSIWCTRWPPCAWPRWRVRRTVRLAVPYHPNLAVASCAWWCRGEVGS